MQIQDHRARVIILLTTALAIACGCQKPPGVRATSQPSASQPAASGPAAGKPGVPASAPEVVAEAEGETGSYAEVDGGKLYYEVAGSGPTIVLIHDELLHGESWNAQVSEFSKDYRVVRYDRRGYGRSPASTAPYSDSDDLLAVLQAVDAGHAALMASSDGAGLAIDFAADHPDMVDALVLSGPTLDGLGYSAHFIRRFQANLGPDRQVSVAKWVEDSCLVAPANRAARERVRALLTANPQNVSREQHRYARIPERDAAASLSEVRAPTMILVGAEDMPDVHAHAGAIEAAISGSQRVVVPDAGHLPHLEQPKAFNDAVRQYLSLIARRLDHRGLRRYTSGFAPVDGGVLYYEMMGQGEPLVLIHGGGIDRRMWDGQVRAFARKYRVIMYDVRGHGLSKGMPPMYHNTEDLRQLLAYLKIRRAHIMGLSLGGGVTIDFAIEHPEMVRTIIPVGPGLSGYVIAGEDVKEGDRRLTEALISGDYEQARELMLRSWTDGPRRTPEQVDPKVRQAVRAMLTHGIAPGRTMGRSLTPNPPAVGRLAEIGAPTMVVVGTIDMSDILKIVDKVCEDIPGAERVNIPDAAHMVNMERPDEFNRAVLEFLSKH